MNRGTAGARINHAIIMLMSCYDATSQQTQNICITFIQRRPNVFDVGPTLHKCYTNVLYLLGVSHSPLWDVNSCRNVNFVFYKYRSTQQTRGVQPKLVWRWANVEDGGPALNQHWLLDVIMKLTLFPLSFLINIFTYLKLSLARMTRNISTRFTCFIPSNIIL